MTALTALTEAKAMFYPDGSANQIVAAEMNWAVAHFDSGASDLILMPVLAWFLVTRVGPYVKGGVTQERAVSVDVYPITVDGVEENPAAIRSPDGLFTIPDQRCNMTAQECLAELKLNPGGGG